MSSKQETVQITFCTQPQPQTSETYFPHAKGPGSRINHLREFSAYTNNTQQSHPKTPLLSSKQAKQVICSFARAGLNRQGGDSCHGRVWYTLSLSPYGFRRLTYHVEHIMPCII